MPEPPRPPVSDTEANAPPSAPTVDHAPLPVLGEVDALMAPDLAPHERVQQALGFVRRGVRTYLDAVGVIVVALGPDGRVLFVNRRGCELLCCAERDILGVDWVETFVPARLREDTRAVLDALWAGKTELAETHENEIVTRTGEERVVAWTNELLRDASGTVWAVVGSGLDITERRYAEQRLARVGQAVEAAHDGIGIIDLSGRTVYMNPALRALTDYTLEALEAVGGPLALFSDAGTGRAAFLWAIREGAWSGEVAMRSRSGTAMTVRLRASVIRDEQDRALGLVGIHTDVTAQKRVEQALRESEAQSRALVEALPDLVILFSPDGVIRDVQIPETSTFPLAASAVGRTLREALPPPLADRLEAGLAETASSGRASMSLLAESDHDYVYEARLVRVEGNGFLGLFHDVTERHRLEAEVLRATDEERQRLGRDLHDGLGSHLVGLGMLVRSLARNAGPDLADELDEVARLVREGAEQARALARGLNPVSIDQQGLAVALHRLASSTDAHTSVRCTFEASDDVPPLRSDVATQLYRIAQEALTNALRHAHAAHIAITLRAEDDAVVLTVTDDGQGVSDAARLETTGLGLQTMAYRARTIGGTFDLRARPAGGTVVTCRLRRPPSGEAEGP